MGWVNSYDTTSFWVIFLFFLLFPLIINPWGMDIFNLPKLTFLALTCLILILFFLLSSLLKGKIIFFKTPLISPFFLYFSLILLSTLFSIDLYRSLFDVYQYREGFFTFFFYFLLFFLVSQASFDESKINRLFRALLFSSVLASVYGIFQYFKIDFLNWKSLNYQAFSTMGNPTYFGAFLSLVIPLLIGFFFHFWIKEGGFLKYLVFLSILILFLALSLTFSRAAWLGTIVGIFVFFLFKKERKKLLWLFLTFVLIFLLLFPFRSDLIKRVTSLRDWEKEARLYLYQIATKLIAKKPILGFGLGSFWTLYYKERSINWVKHDPEKYSAGGRVHNDLLENGISSGLLGILAYFWFYLSLLLFLLKKMKSSLEIGFLASFISYLTTLKFSFTTVEVTPVFWVLLGLSTFLFTREKVDFKFKDMKFFQPFQPFLIFFILLVFLVGVFLTPRSLLADTYTASGLREGNVASKKTREYLLMANHLSNDYFYQRFLASSYLKEAFDERNRKLFEKGVKVFLDSLKMNSWDAELKLADLYLEGSKIFGDEKLLQKALFWCQKANQDNPYQPEIKNRLGVLYARRGLFEKAEEEFKLALMIDPNFYEGLFNLGLFYEENGFLLKAKEAFQKVLILKPNFEPALDGLKRVNKNE